MGNLIDTAITGLTNKKYYLFRGNKYVRYEGGDGVDYPGYPKSINVGWNLLWDNFPGPYDAAFHRSGSTTEYYFFKGDRYIRYTSGEGVDREFKEFGNIGLPIYPWTNPETDVFYQGWRNLWEKFRGPYDAAVVGSANGKYYFFKGSQYVRYTGGVGVDAGYPLPINGDANNPGWRNMYSDFPGPYDAVIALPDDEDDGNYYFFRAGRYAKYIRDFGIDPEYKNSEKNGKSTRYMWPGVWMLGDVVGPMLGPTDSNQDPTIWLWTRAETIENKKFDFSLKTAPVGVTLKTKSKPLPEIIADSHIWVLTISGLPAAEVRNITLRMDVSEPGYQSTFYEWTLPVCKAPSSTTTAPVTFVFGSCLDDARQNPRLDQILSLDAIKNLSPTLNFMIWGGDTTYYVSGESTGMESFSNNDSTGPVNVTKGDLIDRWHMLMRQFTTRTHPSVSTLMQKLPSLSTWDNHDFFFDESQVNNLTLDQINMTTYVFRRMWPNDYLNKDPSDTKPIQHNCTWGQVEVFLPDCRTFRNYQTATILGDQIDLLITEMKNSSAYVKILVLSTQLIPDRDAYSPPANGFPFQAPRERRILLDDPSGSDEGLKFQGKLSVLPGRVLILSGDVHYNELCWYGRDRAKPTLLELTSSPMLVKSSGAPPAPKPDKNMTRIWSGAGQGFARITIEFKAGDRTKPIITMEFFRPPSTSPTKFLWDADGSLKSL